MPPLPALWKTRQRPFLVLCNKAASALVDSLPQRSPVPFPLLQNCIRAVRYSVESTTSPHFVKARARPPAVLGALWRRVAASSTWSITHFLSLVVPTALLCLQNILTLFCRSHAKRVWLLLWLHIEQSCYAMVVSASEDCSIYRLKSL